MFSCYDILWMIVINKEYQSVRIKNTNNQKLILIKNLSQRKNAQSGKFTSKHSVTYILGWRQFSNEIPT